MGRVRRREREKPGKVIHACNPSFMGRIHRRITVQGWSWEKKQDIL
jgi:hypothetical protein